MTLITITNFNGECLYFHGDTISTYGYKQPGFILPEKQSSHGETMKPHKENDIVYSYKENICKIGIISENIVCGFSGDIDMCLGILNIVREEAKSINIPDDFKDVYLKVVRCKLKMTQKDVGRKSSITYCLKQKRYLHVIRIIVSVDSRGDLKYEFKRLKRSHDKYWVDADGSGEPAMHSYSPLGIREIVRDCEQQTVTSLLSFEYSSFIRKQTGNIVRGIGGAFTGMLVTPKESVYQKSTIQFYADNDRVIKYLCKSIYIDGYIVVIDFIHRHVIVMRTIEKELEYRKNRFQENFQKLFDASSSMEAEIVIIAIESEKGTNIEFADNINSNALNIGGNIQFVNGLPIIGKGKISYKAEGGEGELFFQ